MGEAPSDDQIKIILSNVLDPLSKQQVAHEGVDKVKPNQMEDWIDKRFEIKYGNLDYKPGKDDPMGLALVTGQVASEE